MKYLLLDIAQQSNSGDDIMQRTLFDFFKEKGEIVSSSYFGVNEFSIFQGEFSNYTSLYNETVVGGFFNTRYKAFLSCKSYIALKFTRTVVRLFDIAYMLFILSLVSMAFPDFILRVFMGERRFKILHLYRSADIVIWNGRNFRGGNGLLSEFAKVFELCANPLLCLALNKPIYCVGGSVWPLKGALSKFVLSKIFRGCETVWVREASSYKSIKSLGRGVTLSNIRRIPDLSFYMLDQYIDGEGDEIIDSNVISITLVGRKEIPSESTYLVYLSEIASVIEYLNVKGFEVQIVPQVTYRLEPYDKEIQLIRQKLTARANFKVLSDLPSLEALVYEYQNSRLLIASRMHSAIFSASCGTPVVALSYDSGGKWAILQELGVPKTSVLDISTLKKGTLLAVIKLELAILSIRRKNKAVVHFKDSIRLELNTINHISR